jgi:hypothetical protein
LDSAETEEEAAPDRVWAWKKFALEPISGLSSCRHNRLDIFREASVAWAHLLDFGLQRNLVGSFSHLFRPTPVQGEPRPSRNASTYDGVVSVE